MKQYRIQITNRALSDMEQIYEYIAEQLQAPGAAMGQYNRITEAIENLAIFPERIKLMATKEEQTLRLRQMFVDNYSVFFQIRGERVIVTNVLYSASDIVSRLRDE
ncbi:MAG: type II toxin-antitoxin system RelE/ParE family toxin [Firmicutes bacterium]|nr:type II toxin-antitoxin system RelE/ParE family toxin [Bacillota bacterium]